MEIIQRYKQNNWLQGGNFISSQVVIIQNLFFGESENWEIDTSGRAAPGAITNKCGIFDPPADAFYFPSELIRVFRPVIRSIAGATPVPYR